MENRLEELKSSGMSSTGNNNKGHKVKHIGSKFSVWPYRSCQCFYNTASNLLCLPSTAKALWSRSLAALTTALTTDRARLQFLSSSLALLSSWDWRSPSYSLLQPQEKLQVRKKISSETGFYKVLVLYLPVVEDLWDLSSGLVGPVATQAAGAEGEGHPIRTLHCGHTSIPISCPASVVSQSHSVLYALLQQNEFISETRCILTKTSTQLYKVKWLLHVMCMHVTS